MLQGSEATIAKARQLRGDMSLPERLLCNRLKANALSIRFRRQHRAGHHVLDFYCHRARLVVEIDGIAHDMGDRPMRDRDRDAYRRTLGRDIIRLASADVLRDPNEIADAILAVVTKRAAGEA